MHMKQAANAINIPPFYPTILPELKHAMCLFIGMTTENREKYTSYFRDHQLNKQKLKTYEPLEPPLSASIRRTSLTEFLAQANL